MTLDHQYSFVIISDSTSSRQLATLDLKDIQNNTLDSSAIGRLNNPVWKKFLSNVDVNNIPNQKLTKSFDNNKKIRFVSEVKDFYQQRANSSPKRKYKNAYGTFIFSPVVFSEDGNKAVCTLHIFQGPEAASTTVFFLEKDKDDWNIYTRILSSIS